MNKEGMITVVLVGNPNCGKSTIFNKLTGLRQTVGNFPGVTVEKQEGCFSFQDRRIKIVDLPGLYSLTSSSNEEQASVNYLETENPNVIVNVVDASNLERNLYLTLQLKELNIPLLVVLNRGDIARHRGIEIDIEALSRELQIPIIETIGYRGTGLNAALEQILALNEVSVIENDTIERVLKQDKTTETSEKSKKHTPSCVKWGCKGCSHMNCHNNRQTELLLQTAQDVAQYKKITRICIHCVQSVIPLEKSFSDKLDRFLTNRYFGIPLFLLAMYLVFQLTFTIGQYPMNWLESCFQGLANIIASYWPEGRLLFIKSLLIDGVIGGVGGVLVFLPNIMLLFLSISILEDSGYLARAAVLCDRWLYKTGLHGRSIVPMLIGFGCTVPAMMATKMLSNRRERLTTMFILPLFSCGARLPIYAMLIPAFFPLQWQGPILWSMYFIGIVLAILIAKVVSLFFKERNEDPFIIELPPYHFPTVRTVGIQTLIQCGQYVKKAGTVILGISVLLWYLSNYPGLPTDKVEYFNGARSLAEKNITDSDALQTKLAEIDEEESQLRLSKSYSGRIGHLLEPILKPIGFDWKIGTALVGAFAAKEVFVAQMGIVYSSGEMDNNENRTGLSNILAENYSPLTGFCVMLFCLIASPCMATFAIMAKESYSWKWAMVQWCFLTLLAWGLCLIVYQTGLFFVS